ncbi:MULTISPECIES: AzlC family ABC transporter permease [Microbacterium]|uniref:Branched-chain amino acid ABC transporter permease n=1 Tax=Microbacterium wangchenii TaxID=2541726 RepID=A0ABX5SSX1_9MICO|nr:MULTISPECIES: AzlC family ABC transporter permease [Microbacterium]MCK6067842.1 AzlC family ABC transporter permease [Microbacterium sp. EYE_512]QBR89261.1 branched-chain amino acid ABC transporter permease [Microbacterium wangchenii]TFV81677.1 branched-chain amino acid ABC transporter permease [Microbacterium sp. dk485]TXK10934.1 AzlC family ABC transporter permease [Microbacterium wangchenii]
MSAAPEPADEQRRATRQGLAVALATSAYGVSFGALAVASGLDVWQTCVLSALMFTGGSQFAFVGVVGAGGVAAAPAAIASSALLGVRNAAYAMRMSPVIGPGFWRRAGAAQFTIDESTAVSLAQTDPRARTRGFWVTGIGIYIGWNISTLLGALLGDVLGDPRQYGLDAAAAAAFLALLWPRLRGRQALAVGAAAAVLAAVLTPGLMPGLPVIVAAAVAVVVGWFNWLGRSERPAPEPPDVPEREGLP